MDYKDVDDLSIAAFMNIDKTPTRKQLRIVHMSNPAGVTAMNVDGDDLVQSSVVLNFHHIAELYEMILNDRQINKPMKPIDRDEFLILMQEMAMLTHSV